MIFIDTPVLMPHCHSPDAMMRTPVSILLSLPRLMLSLPDYIMLPDID